MEEEVKEEKTEARGDNDRSEQREEAEKAPLLNAMKRVLQARREELRLLDVLMTERPKIRPFRTAFRRRTD